MVFNFRGHLTNHPHAFYPRFASPQGHESVGGLPGLRDEEAHVVPEDGRTAVQEVGGKVDHYGQLGEFLEQLAGCDSRVVGGAAGDQEQAAAAADLVQVVLP